MHVNVRGTIKHIASLTNEELRAAIETETDRDRQKKMKAALASRPQAKERKYCPDWTLPAEEAKAITEQHGANYIPPGYHQQQYPPDHTQQSWTLGVGIFKYDSGDPRAVELRRRS